MGWTVYGGYWGIDWNALACQRLKKCAVFQGSTSVLHNAFDLLHVGGNGTSWSAFDGHSMVDVSGG